MRETKTERMEFGRASLSISSNVTLQLPLSTTTFSSASNSSLISLIKRGWPLVLFQIACARGRGMVLTWKMATQRTRGGTERRASASTVS